MEQVDSIVAQMTVWAFGDNAAVQQVLVALTGTNVTKALLFAPFLLAAWYGKRDGAKEKVLCCMASCCLALALTWCLTSTVGRYRPVDPRSGLEAISEVFFKYFAADPGRFEAGCFPSEHMAYLTALSLGLFTLNRGVGVAALVVSVGLQGMFRMAVGLHFLSDVLVGVALGAAAHWAVFSVLALPRNGYVKRVGVVVEQSSLLQVGLVLVVVEMAVVFGDVRFLGGVFSGGAG